MENCAICKKDRETVNEYEFYFGKTVDQFTTNWNSGAIYLTGTTKSYAIHEQPIKGYLCDSCVTSRTLKTHIKACVTWLVVMAVPWLMLYMIGRHVETSQTAYIVFYICLLIIISQIIATAVIMGLQPRKVMDRIFSPFSVLYSKQGLEKHGDMLLSILKRDEIPPDADTILSRKSYTVLNSYY